MRAANGSGHRHGLESLLRGRPIGACHRQQGLDHALHADGSSCRLSQKLVQACDILAREPGFTEGADLGERCPQLVGEVRGETPLVLEGLRQTLEQLIEALAQGADLGRHTAERQGPRGLIDGDLLGRAPHSLERLQTTAYGEHRGERANAEDRYDAAKKDEIDLPQQPISLREIDCLGSEAALDVAIDEPVDDDLKHRQAQSHTKQQRDQQASLQGAAGPLTEHDSQSLGGSR